MKLDNNGANVSNKDILKARGSLYYKRGRGGTVHAQAWPRRRGKKRTPIEQAWTADFVSSAKRSKDPDPCAASIAMPWVAGTGFYYRDLLEYADHGKLIDTSGRHPNNVYDGARKYQGKFRVLTPTAFVKMSAPVTVPGTAFFTINPNTKIWDNNAFWNPTTNPSRLTAKVAGLYMVGALVNWDHSGSGAREARLIQNGSGYIARAVVDASHNNDHTILLQTIWPFNAGDYVEAGCSTSATGITYQLQNFWIVAITGETLV